MFNQLRRELRRLEGSHHVSVSVQSDEDGYLDRQCPVRDCGFEFKVHLEDWQDVIQNSAVCPFCGHLAEPHVWNTQEQSEHFREIALSYLRKRIGRAMRHDAKQWNRRQPRKGPVSVTMNVKGRPERIILPPPAADLMRLRLRCQECGCRYAFVGTAYFCPGCGEQDSEAHFVQTVSGLRRQLKALPEVSAGITDRDAAEDIRRVLIEYVLQQVVTAFQVYAESMYCKLANGSEPQPNAFQNLERGSKLWCDVTGERYSEYISNGEIKELKRAFQQRHLLAHTEGIVDKNYVERSGDSTHEIGQRIVINDTTVRQYLDVIEKLGAGLKKAKSRMLSQSSGVEFEVSDEP